MAPPRSGRAESLLLVLLSGCALVLPQSSLDSVPRGAPPPMEVFAGSARVALTPVDHPVPLAGFGPHPRLAERAESDLFVRAVSLRGAAPIASDTDRVVLVSVEMLVAPLPVVAAVRARTRDLERTQVIVTATHTHCGIGGFWKGALPEWASVGPYDPAETARVVSCIAACVHSAVHEERPARFAWSAVKRGDLVESRVGHTRITDQDLLALAVDGADGAPIARIAFFASHPTELYGSDFLSPSWPGAFSRELEQRGGVALLLQQGLGDQRPAFPPAVYQNMVANVTSSGRLAKSRAYGKTVALAFRDALADEERASKITLRVARAPFDLPPPTLGVCPFPILDRALAIPVALPYWPRRAWLTALRLGDVVVVFAPFEVVAPSSIRAKSRLREAGFSDAAVVSLADGWLGYAPDFLPLPWTTSGAASFGGVGFGYALAERVVELGERLR